MNEVVDPLDGIAFLLSQFFQGFTASLIIRSSSFTLPAVMEETSIALQICSSF